MIALYHFGFSTCSQKVRLVLAEKGLEFESREVNLIAGEQHAPEYVELNPHHVVPTLVHDGEVLIESSLIIGYLDDAFPEPPLRPREALGRYRVASWLKSFDEELHVAAPTVTSRSDRAGCCSSSRGRCGRPTSPGSRTRRRGSAGAA